MNNAKPEYEEPWEIVSSHTDSSGLKYTNVIKTSKGNVIDKKLRRRILPCVNFLAGVSDSFLLSHLHHKTANSIINLMLAWMQNPNETTPLLMLVDEIMACVDSNKPYVTRGQLETKLLEMGESLFDG